MLLMRGAAHQEYTIEGRSYRADRDGLIEVDDHHVEAMKKFGCHKFNPHAEEHRAGDVLRK